jgi:formylglycine-generating enzyme required for sulfatase activity
VFVAFGLSAIACTLTVNTGGLSQLPDPIDASFLDAAPIADASMDAADGARFDPQAPCPAKSAKMINVGTHCIDATEVTVGQYDEFVATVSDGGVFDPRNESAFCSWNTDIQHGSFALTDDQAVTGVDWCDAFAFCRWAGKRLCGSRQNGPTAFSKWSDPAESQWHYACTSGGKNAWVYGNTYSPTTCRGRDYGDGNDYAGPVRAATACKASEPPFQGIYDLAGNAEEWEDSCDGATDDNDMCRSRGGDRQSPAAGTRCDADVTRLRKDREVNLGFRCCWP